MTTIIWDGKTLVGDRQSTSGTTATPTTKVFKVVTDRGTFLFGCAGNGAQCDAYRDWAHGRIDKPEFSNLDVMCIAEDGVYLTNQDMLWSKMNVRCWAIGSGCDYALAAMVCGKESREAMAVTMQLDIYTGLGFDEVSF